MLVRDLCCMNKARATSRIRFSTSRHVSKFVAIGATTAVVISLAGYAAGASTNQWVPVSLGVGSLTVPVKTPVIPHIVRHHVRRSPSTRRPIRTISEPTAPFLGIAAITLPLVTATTSHSVTPTSSAFDPATSSPRRSTTKPKHTTPTTTPPSRPITSTPDPTTTTLGSPTTTPAPTTTVLAPTTTLPAPPTTVPAPTTTLPPPPTTTVPATGSPYPLGNASGSAPSGMAPPGANAFNGYSLSYVNDFGGTTLPAGWSSYSGKPGGDPGAQWADNHVAVSGGLLQLNTFQDSAFNNEWVAGGLCQCGVARTYGAYFVRSRVTGAGPTNVELLWPTGPSWPPEIDFNETNGASTGTSATTIWAISGSDRSQVQTNLNINMTQWHTWGVVWTPASITYTVDGHAWGSVNVPSEIPNQPMTLDLQQQTWCASGFACPSSPQTMQVDWVAEYSAN